MPAPRKAAAKATSPKVARPPDKPAAVSLNLDTLEREATPEPFVIILGGERYQMNDAMELDWKDLEAAQSNPVSFVNLVIEDRQRDKFFANKLTVWQINKLMVAYMEHHGMAVPGEIHALLT